MVLNIDDFDVLKFYGYTSLIPINARINEVSSIDDNPGNRNVIKNWNHFIIR